jgi:hypothetical protein
MPSQKFSAIVVVHKRSHKLLEYRVLKPLLQYLENEASQAFFHGRIQHRVSDDAPHPRSPLQRRRMNNWHIQESLHFRFVQHQQKLSSQPLGKYFITSVIDSQSPPLVQDQYPVVNPSTCQ